MILEIQISGLDMMKTLDSLLAANKLKLYLEDDHINIVYDIIKSYDGKKFVGYDDHVLSMIDSDQLDELYKSKKPFANINNFRKFVDTIGPILGVDDQYGDEIPFWQISNAFKQMDKAILHYNNATISSDIVNYIYPNKVVSTNKSYHESFKISNNKLKYPLGIGFSTDSAELFSDVNKIWRNISSLCDSINQDAKISPLLEEYGIMIDYNNDVYFLGNSAEGDFTFQGTTYLANQHLWPVKIASHILAHSRQELVLGACIRALNVVKAFGIDTLGGSLINKLEKTVDGLKDFANKNAN